MENQALIIGYRHDFGNQMDPGRLSKESFWKFTFPGWYLEAQGTVVSRNGGFEAWDLGHRILMKTMMKWLFMRQVPSVFEDSRICDAAKICILF